MEIGFANRTEKTMEIEEIALLLSVIVCKEYKVICTIHSEFIKKVENMYIQIIWRSILYSYHLLPK